MGMLRDVLCVPTMLSNSQNILVIEKWGVSLNAFIHTFNGGKFKPTILYNTIVYCILKRETLLL